jgi:hypothetical protein
MSLVLLVVTIYISHVTSFETQRVNLFQILIVLHMNHLLFISFVASPNEIKYIYFRHLI